jgi:DNA-binding transcriptional regulator GbsR (MarR family)
MIVTHPNSAATEAPLRTTLVIGNGRDPDIVEFEIALVSFFIEAADLLGVPKSVAAIYGVCFASPEPLSFLDIEQRLDISRGSISQGLRVLREVGALKAVSGPLDRRELFTPDLELRKLAIHWIEQRLHKQLNSGRTRLQGIAKAVPSGRGASAKVLRDRLKTLQAWHDKTRALLPLMKTFLKLA